MNANARIPKRTKLKETVDKNARNGPEWSQHSGSRDSNVDPREQAMPLGGPPRSGPGGPARGQFGRSSTQDGERRAGGNWDRDREWGRERERGSRTGSPNRKRSGPKDYRKMSGLTSGQEFPDDFQAPRNQGQRSHHPSSPSQQDFSRAREKEHDRPRERGWSRDVEERPERDREKDHRSERDRERGGWERSKDRDTQGSVDRKEREKEKRESHSLSPVTSSSKTREGSLKTSVRPASAPSGSENESDLREPVKPSLTIQTKVTLSLKDETRSALLASNEAEIPNKRKRSSRISLSPKVLERVALASDHEGMDSGATEKESQLSPALTFTGRQPPGKNSRKITKSSTPKTSSAGGEPKVLQQPESPAISNSPSLSNSPLVGTQSFRASERAGDVSKYDGSGSEETPTFSTESMSRASRLLQRTERASRSKSDTGPRLRRAQTGSTPSPTPSAIIMAPPLKTSYSVGSFCAAPSPSHLGSDQEEKCNEDEATEEEYQFEEEEDEKEFQDDNVLLRDSRPSFYPNIPIPTDLVLQESSFANLRKSASNKLTFSNLKESEKQSLLKELKKAISLCEKQKKFFQKQLKLMDRYKESVYPNEEYPDTTTAELGGQDLLRKDDSELLQMFEEIDGGFFGNSFETGEQTGAVGLENTNSLSVIDACWMQNDEGPETMFELDENDPLFDLSSGHTGEDQEMASQDQINSATAPPLLEKKEGKNLASMRRQKDKLINSLSYTVRPTAGTESAMPWIAQSPSVASYSSSPNAFNSTPAHEMTYEVCPTTPHQLFDNQAKFIETQAQKTALRVQVRLRCYGAKGLEKPLEAQFNDADELRLLKDRASSAHKTNSEMKSHQDEGIEEVGACRIVLHPEHFVGSPQHSSRHAQKIDEDASPIDEAEEVFDLDANSDNLWRWLDLSGYFKTDKNEIEQKLKRLEQQESYLKEKTLPEILPERRAHLNQFAPWSDAGIYEGPPESKLPNTGIAQRLIAALISTDDDTCMNTAILSSRFSVPKQEEESKNGAPRFTCCTNSECLHSDNRDIDVSNFDLESRLYVQLRSVGLFSETRPLIVPEWQREDDEICVEYRYLEKELQQHQTEFRANFRRLKKNIGDQLSR